MVANSAGCNTIICAPALCTTTQSMYLVLLHLRLVTISAALPLCESRPALAISHTKITAVLATPTDPRLLLPLFLLTVQTMAPGTKLSPAVHVSHDTPWERRDLLGVHPQKQEGLSWVGVSVPSGRLHADDLDVSSCADIARTALLWHGVMDLFATV